MQRYKIIDNFILEVDPSRNNCIYELVEEPSNVKERYIIVAYTVDRLNKINKERKEYVKSSGYVFSKNDSYMAFIKFLEFKRYSQNNEYFKFIKNIKWTNNLK